MNIFATDTYVDVSAPVAFDAFSKMTDIITEKGGTWEVKGPIETGILNGQIVTGYMYIAKKTS